MSKSRLEKFLYALYSLDSSDLPTPLSRIEELYKCLVTGEEAPTFKPISRVEKYLMAILGAYNVNELPNPLSRVEVLLYKLATGDDSLEDFDTFLSEHEELLAGIIRNGGVGGNIDIEYVLYTLSTEFNTLYNTAEKPVKSAILKGNTLVNIADVSTIAAYNGASISDETIILDRSINASLVQITSANKLIQSGKKYIAILNEINGNTQGIALKVQHASGVETVNFVNNRAIFIADTDLYNRWVFVEGVFLGSDAGTTSFKWSIIEYQEGMENWDIPYFEGMQSVKMPVLTATGANVFSDDNTDCKFALMINDVYPYESYQSNILTVNEPVELRGIGDVRDTLDLMTGEVVERIGEIVLDGSDDEQLVLYSSQKLVYQGILYSDKYISNHQLKKIYYNKIDRFCIEVPDTITSISEARQWLSENNVIIQFPLTEESIKTVDLSVVDQDGNNTKLKTFDDITHVTLSSEGLIPEAELEVATKNEEDLDDSIVYTNHTLSEEHNTLYNTAEKPVKSAILKGHTLVNVNRSNFVADSDITGDYKNAILKFDIDMKASTTYTVIGYSDNQYEYRLSEMRNQGAIEAGLGVFKVGVPYILNTDSNCSGLRGYLKGTVLTIPKGTEVKILIVEGDYTNIDIPFFEGMQSVKIPVLTTTGKNLFDITKHNDLIINDNGEYITTKYYSEATPVKYSLKKNTTYSVSYVKNGTFSMSVNGVWVNTNGSSAKFTTDDSGEYIIKIGANSYNTINNKIWDNIRIEEGSATEYEPYKSNILTANEDVTLRGIGEVKDELNLLNGELTQRIVEVVLDGSENWYLDEAASTSQPNTNIFYTEKYKEFKPLTTVERASSMLCDKLPVIPTLYHEDVVGIMINKDPRVYVRMLKIDVPDVNSLTTYLSQNPITVKVQRSNVAVKTVDLSVVDQDGNNTKLKTFDDITHVTLSSEGLIPEAELEVAEKVPEVAASMLTISREQESIDTATNEQSENVDATMIATTEIYEGLL